MRKILFTISLLLICFAISQGQSKSISGVVYNIKNNQAIAKTNIVVEGTNIGTTTDFYGEFNLENFNSEIINLVISHVGYKTIKEKINIAEENNKVLEIYLTPISIPIGETIVTSTRYKKQVKDVSLPLEIMDDYAIKNYSPNSISDILDLKPGLSISKDGAWGSLINIRGLSKQNVVKLIDGNRIETTTNIAAGMSLIDLNDVERIEVIKGAASSLYGSGALGGVINIISKRIGYKDNYYFHGSMNSGYNSVNNLGSGNLSLFSGGANWYAKVSSTLRSADNTDTPNGNLQNSQFKDNNISANIGLAPFDNHEIDVKYQRFYAEDVGIPGGSAFPAPATAKYPEELRKMYSVEYRINNLLTYLSNLAVKYFHQTIERRVELRPNPNAIIRPNANHGTKGMQLQTNWILGKRNILIAGIDAWQRDMTSWRTKTIIPKNQVVGEIPVPKSDYRSIGFFVQDEMQLIENKLNLTLGGRVDHIKVTNNESYNPDYIIVNGIRNSNPPAQVKLWDADEEDDISASANLSLLYNLTNQFDITFNMAQSFRSPSLEERYQYIQLGGATYLGTPDLEPEKGTFLDLGLRIWSPYLSFSGNIFANYLSNLVIDEYQSEVSYVKNNVGKARLYGFDFSVEYNLYRDYVIYCSGAYVKGEDTENDLNLPEIPPLNGTIGMKLPIANYINIDLRSTFYNEQNNVADGEVKTSGYGRFDIYVKSVPIKLGLISFNISTGVENVFNKAYRNHLSTYRGLIRLEPGRNFFAKLLLEF